MGVKKETRESRPLIPAASLRPRRMPSKARCSLNAVILGAIIIVLANHWRLALHRVEDLNANHLSSSLNEFVSSRFDLQNKMNNQLGDPYILSPFCGGCYRSRNNKKTPCVDIILERQQKEENLSLSSAARKVAKEIQECKLCDPEYCWENYFNETRKNDGGQQQHNRNHNFENYQTKYWRFDRSKPKFTHPTTLSLPSIPSQNRIPPSRFKNISAYFMEKYASSPLGFDSGIDFLVEYNPGLAVIPSKMKENLPVEAVYLVSLRVTPANNCFPQNEYQKLPKEVREAVYQGMKNHLGLALLDENYQILPGYDVVIQLDNQLGLERTMKKFDSPTFMDYRLFLLNGEIYLHANVDTVAVSKIELRAKGFGNDNENTAHEEGIVAGSEDRLDRPYKLKNLYGMDNLEVTLLRQFITIWSGGITGKNYALFAVPNTTQPDAPDSIYVEIKITPNHHVQQVLPDEYDQINLTKVFGLIWKPGTKKSRVANIDKVSQRSMKLIGDMTKSDVAPIPSFSTVDEYWFPGGRSPFKENAHGGACCVSFSLDEINVGGAQNNHHESLLVGIAHTKVPWQPWYSKAHIPKERKDLVPHTHYVSFFYAFDPRPPFQLRARSGYFCLGFADSIDSGEGGTFNQHSILTHDRPLLQHNETFLCPQIEYISTFIEKAGDSSKTVVGYGLNDCTSRLVEVEKKEIVRMLYPDPFDMVFEPF